MYKWDIGTGTVHPRSLTYLEITGKNKGKVKHYAIKEVNGQLHAPAALPPGKEPHVPIG
jgi:hypothetical protein